MNDVPHFAGLSDLLAAVPELDLSHYDGGRPAATFHLLGTTWTVTWDTYPSRLIEFCEHVLAGGKIHERQTKNGRALSDRPGKPDRLYIYEVSDVSSREQQARKTPSTVCCDMVQPSGSECAYCGEVVA